MKLRVLLCTVLLEVLGFVNGEWESEACRISSTLSGTCVSIYDCPQVSRVFDSRPLKPEVTQYLRRLQCGFRHYTPLVCCSDQLDFQSLSTHRPGPSPTRRTTARPLSTQSGRLTKAPQEGASLLPAAGSCGIGTFSNKIFNGEITDIDEFPWMALLGYKSIKNGSRRFECGGVLISKRYVLTAAHCMVGKVTTSIGQLEIVRLGEYDLQTDVDCLDDGEEKDCAPPHQDIPVELEIPHPGFSDNNVNRKDDIALVRLARDAEFHDFVRPICLPNTATLRTPSDVRLAVAGWGKTLSGKSSSVKLKILLPLFDRARCLTLYSQLRAALTPGQICAGGEFARDTCTGDSGGPLMEGKAEVWTAIGVVSFGYGCGRDGWPGVYTNVGSYIDWITDNIKP